MNFDTLIRGGTVVDGSGAPPVLADVGIRDNVIAAVGPLGQASAMRIIDAAGRHVSPGFIDTHTHTDLALLAEGNVVAKVSQGVTTELIGQDGLSYAPLSPARLAEQRAYLKVFNGDPPLAARWSTVAEFLDAHAGAIAQNVAFLVPHGALRIEAMGWHERSATAAEIGRMAAALDQGLAEGAVGLGSGLDYFPQTAATFGELVALAEVVARHDAVFVAHTRNQELGIVRAVAELTEVARRTGARVHVSHLRKAEALPEIDAALAEGIRVTFDVYPYTFGSSSLTMYLPGVILAGGMSDVVRRLRDASFRQTLSADLERRLRPQIDRLTICNVGNAECEAFVGKTVAHALNEVGGAFTDAVIELFVRCNLMVGFIGHHVSEESLQACIRHPAAMGSSDAILVGQQPHPRGWGSFPRFIGRYVRELDLLPLAEAVRQLTAFPAEVYRMGKRGRVAPGCIADIVVFDLAQISDRATPTGPRQPSAGIDHVLVGGETVWDGGRASARRPGAVIRPSGIQGAKERPRRDRGRAYG